MGKLADWQSVLFLKELETPAHRLSYHLLPNLDESRTVTNTAIPFDLKFCLFNILSSEIAADR